MKRTLATLLVPLAIACGNPQAHNREFRSNIDLPVGEVATEMAHDVRSRNFSDAAQRPFEHSYSLGRVSEGQEVKYRQGVTQDTTNFTQRLKSCYHDTDLAHCAPKLGEYFPFLIDWEDR
jgi:hypothetical protein